MQNYDKILTYANNLAKNLQNCEKCCIFAAKFSIMETIDIKKQLTEIASKADKLTADDRKTVTAECERLGIKFEPKKAGCKSCYQDAALACLDALRNNGQAAEHDGRAYVLRKGVDVFFGSIRVNEHTLTDELAERIIARGFDTKFFARCK